MIDTLAQRTRWLSAIALLAALFVSSCTAPLPPRRQTQAGAGGVARTTGTLTVSAALSPTVAVTTTLRISATWTVAPAPILTGTTTTATPSQASTSVPPALELTTVPTIAATIAVTAPATTPPATPTATRVMAQATVAANPVVSATVRATARMSPTATVAQPSASLTPTSIPSATSRPFVTGALTQTVSPSPTLPPEATATPSPAVTPTALALVFSTPMPIAVASATPAAETPLAATPAPFPLQPAAYKTGNVLHNGDFEAGFDPHGLGDGWQGFGRVAGVFGWSDETYPTLVFQGQHAQMMRIRTTQYPDAYIGVYQTVPVVQGKPYELELHGMIRSTEGSPEKSKWGYRLQWGTDPKGGVNWQAVTEWIDLGWDEQSIGAPSPTLAEYQDTVTPTGNTLTLFIRGWRKWTVPTSEGEFIIDGVSLTGPLPVKVTAARLPGTGADPNGFLSR